MKARAQIVVFSPLYPPRVGGLESHAEQWNREMVRAGYTVTVWTPLLVPGSREAETRHGVHVRRYPAWQLIANYPLPAFWRPAFWRQVRSLIHTPCDVVVSRTRFFFSSFLALLYARARRRPLLHIEHGSDFVHLHQAVLRAGAKAYDHTLGRWLLAAADRVVTNSEASARFVRRFTDRTDIAVIYRGIDAATIAAIPPVSRPTPMLPVITYTGRLISGKGLIDLIEALARIRDLPWHCWIIGDGPDRQRLAATVRHWQLEQRVVFLGERPWREAIAHMKASDIIVNPSYAEGLPTSIIEAALCRRAIVATAVGGTTEIVTDTVSALLVPPRNVARLAAALQTLVTDATLRQTLAEQASAEVATKFSWQNSMPRYLRLIDALCANA